MIKTITATELKNQLKQGNILLIDVREPAEHEAESIPGSHLIPLKQLCCEKLPSTESPLVMHCRFGRRSEEACKKLLLENPLLDVTSLEGGITAWKEAGYPVISEG